MSDGDHTPRILVSNRHPAPVDEGSLIELARACLTGEGAARSELSVSFVTADEMADLHARYLDEEGPTDVLSFPLGDTDEGGAQILGDVVIAPDVAAANHPEDPAAELRLLLVHGILHLLGHDHDDEGERAEMWAKQERYAGVRVP
ncbi:MAG: rRNA maturation RNase YbeY [Actinomycetota bacterium]